MQYLKARLGAYQIWERLKVVPLSYTGALLTNIRLGWKGLSGTCLFGLVDTDKDKSVYPGNTKGGSITVQLISCLTGLESAV